MKSSYDKRLTEKTVLSTWRIDLKAAPAKVDSAITPVQPEDKTKYTGLVANCDD
jgi:hypothetical protein